MPPVYQGRNSCTAAREGWYVRRIEEPGIDTIDEAVALAYAVLRDWRRGYTYRKEDCRRVRMTWALAVKRLNYIHTLAVKHGASKRELQTIARLIGYTVKHRRLPRAIGGRSVKTIIKRMIVKAGK